MMRYYEDILGYVPSDYVNADTDDPESKKVAFYRSDPEHHSFAVFAASDVRSDHHAYEVDDWNAVRDWADHMSALRTSRSGGVPDVTVQATICSS